MSPQKYCSLISITQISYWKNVLAYRKGLCLNSLYNQSTHCISFLLLRNKRSTYLAAYNSSYYLTVFSWVCRQGGNLGWGLNWAWRGEGSASKLSRAEFGSEREVRVPRNAIMELTSPQPCRILLVRRKLQVPPTLMGKEFHKNVNTRSRGQQCCLKHLFTTLANRG